LRYPAALAEQYQGIVRLTYDRSFDACFGDAKRWLASGEHVLDIGCGNGLVAANLMRSTGVRITGIDVGDFRMADIPFQDFDGTTIPFDDRQFDTSLLGFVLHHVRDQASLLSEAKRVTSKQIIVYEDIVDNLVAKALGSIHATLFSLHYGVKRVENFRGETEWEDYFRSLDLRVVEKSTIRRRLNVFYPIKRMRFVLEVDDGR
jgi:SAM-dependent methyltransferase